MSSASYIQVRMFEASRPFVIESEGLRNEVQRLRECLSEEEERVKKVNKVWSVGMYTIYYIILICDQALWYV